jgi:hypothetical protein
VTYAPFTVNYNGSMNFKLTQPMSTYITVWGKKKTNEIRLSIFLTDFESHLLGTGRADNMLNKNLYVQ